MDHLHLSTGDLYLNPDKGFFYFLPVEELEDFLEEESSHYTPIPDHELLKVFPEAKSFVKEQLKTFKRYLSNEADEQVAAGEDEFKLEMCDYRRELLQKAIKRLERMLAPFDSKKRGETLARLKDVPIDSLVKFNRAGFAYCVYHSEKTPSMKLYRDQNRFHCFSCGNGGDSVDIQMFLTGKTLKELLA
jgi:hypothetical protein